jgi:hypothetical protein
MIIIAMNREMRKCRAYHARGGPTVQHLDTVRRPERSVPPSVSFPNVLRSLKLTFPDQDVRKLELLARDLCNPGD